MKKYALLAVLAGAVLLAVQRPGPAARFDSWKIIGSRRRGVFGASQHIYDVTLDPRNPKVLYNCGFESGAYRSADGGETWNRIPAFNFKWGHRVIPDPLDPDRIYITTFGGSVWHGPAKGDPSAVEDIITPIKVARPPR